MHPRSLDRTARRHDAAHGSTAGGGTHGDSAAHHVLPMSLYLGVFGALLVLTVVTVWVSTIGLPPLLSIVVAMIVATIKATLVVLYFMHLKYDLKFRMLIFVASLFFVGIFFVMTLMDMRTRGDVISEHANGLYEEYEGKQNKGQREDVKGSDSAQPMTK